MKFVQSDLFKTFTALSNDELKLLKKAIASPFFNLREEEIRLFDFLSEAKKTNKQQYDVEEICAVVLPDEPFNLPALRHVMTYLLRIIHRYLSISEMEYDAALNQLLLARSLRRKKLGKQFLAQYNVAKQFNDTLPLNPALYYQRLLLNTEHYLFSVSDRRPQDVNLEALSGDLDSFFAIQKLKQACTILSYRNIFKNDYEPQLLNDVLVLVNKGAFAGNPLINLLYYSYLTLAEPENETHFTRLKETLMHDTQSIETAELKDVFTLAINYCIKRLNTGNHAYYRQVFDIYRTGLEKNIFIEEGKLSPFTYKNVASVALGLNEFKWAFDFIKEYRYRLEETLREGIYAYCLARYFFMQREYDRVTALLREVEINDVFTEMDSRVLLIKAYYELDEYDLLGYAIDNFKQLLKRRKLQTYHETVYGNFISMVKKLLGIRRYDEKAKQLFSKKLDEMNAVAEKDWLKSKVTAP